MRDFPVKSKVLYNGKTYRVLGFYNTPEIASGELHLKPLDESESIPTKDNPITVNPYNELVQKLEE